MLQRVRVRGFKSIEDVDLELKPLVLLFGPNTAGKSNFLEALLVLSRFATGRTLSDTLDPPLRGYPVEAFTLPESGLEGLLAQPAAKFTLGCDLGVEPDEKSRQERFRYEVELRIEPKTGAIQLESELLCALTKEGAPRGSARLEKDGDHLLVRQRERPGAPIRVPLPLNHTVLSNLQYTGNRYPDLDRVRDEMSNWRTYYLDPRAMRDPQPPREVTDIGPRGEWIAPFLYRLKNHPEHGRQFKAVARAVRQAIPTVESLDVELDPRRGTLDIFIRQDGTPYSSRVISEGTLRILALCAIAANPWPGSLVAFEEPENGVHPRRIEIIADLLTSMSRGRQVVITSHSPTLVASLIRRQQRDPDRVKILRGFREGRASRILPFESDDDIYRDSEIQAALRGDEDEQTQGLIEAMLVRGWLDGR